MAPPTPKRLVLAAVAVIAAADLLLPRVRSRAAIALLDEPAHVATTWLAVTALAPRATRPALIASTLLDADHVPSELGSDLLRRGTARPYGHTGAAVLAVAVVSPAAALGVAAHLLRDAASEPGITVWRRPRTIPRAAYYALVVSAAARVALRTAGPLPPRPAP